MEFIYGASYFRESGKVDLIDPDGSFNLVALGGIEPPAQGFSIRAPHKRACPNDVELTGGSPRLLTTADDLLHISAADRTRQESQS